ncbi:small ubiquitin-related modifier 1-like [Symsagittifera roscoffensis]|uniref:small ubiquitin-related modifier 1-like n=1 Tax=Symsagittifera roscoffensis TaxID=84072 RepID=UPI00307B73D8
MTDTGNGDNATTQKSNDYVTLKVLKDGAGEVHFRVKMTTKMSKLKSNFCDRQGLNMASVRFTFEGQRIEDDMTPADLDLQDDDLIEVFSEQTGGFFKL